MMLGSCATDPEFFLTSGKHKGRHINQVDDGYVPKNFSNSPASQVKAQGTNAPALLTALKSCSMRRDLAWGRRIHARAVASRNHSNIYILTALVKMYAKCSSMVDARRVFDSINKPDVVSWTVLLLGYVENGEGRAALGLFSAMKASGFGPNSVTYVAALKACTILAVSGEGTREDSLKRGREIHSEIGCHLNYYVQSTLIDMYAKCGSMVDARFVFDSIHFPDVVSWTALLLGYAENGNGRDALDLFSRMREAGCAPNSVTYVAALKACTSLAVNGDSSVKNCLQRGRGIHSEIGCNLNLYVQSALIDMYAKCGSMVDARRVFDSILLPDVVTWTALLLGYAENGDGHLTLDLFFEMKSNGYVPNSITYVAALKACSLIGALALGRRLHSEISDFTTLLVTCLVDFYAKCGSMVEAHEVFDLHPRERDVSTWTALLAGYGSFGDTVSVFNLFEVMQDKGIQPDGVTFVCMLLCCSHAGLVEKAREYLEAMPVKYGITPTVMHYNCMVDVLGRANQLNEAVAMLRNMPCKPDAVTWRALLGACRKWKNVEIGRLAFQALVDIDDQDASAYVLMAQIYGRKGTREEQESMLEARTNTGSWEREGQAYVLDEAGNTVGFVVEGQDLPIKDRLEQLMKDELYSIVDGEKEEALCGHSERRAVVYGIAKARLGGAVRVFKDTRMCEECHALIKMISKLVGRVVMIRDAKSFHVMQNGRCSCGDYW